MIAARGALAVAATLVFALGAASASQAREPAPDHPNVVVVMTDDQTVESLRVMPKVQRLIGDEGVTFANNFAANPICCPSRSTFLSGRYSHNTGVLRNRHPAGGCAAYDGT
jgi:arylsulfatase A-like enzyme